MAEKTINSRIIHKHDVEANWLKAINFIPQQGEIIIYDIDANYNYERFKIGDGITNINNLPFANQSDWNVTDENSSGYIKNKPEETTEDEIIDLLISMDMMPVVTDEYGNIMTDEYDAILLV